jgi:hypothetical protein
MALLASDHNSAETLRHESCRIAAYTAYPSTPNIDVEVWTNYNGDGQYMGVPDIPTLNDEVESCGGGGCSWGPWTNPPVAGAFIAHPADPAGYEYYASADPSSMTNFTNWHSCGPIYYTGIC